MSKLTLFVISSPFLRWSVHLMPYSIFKCGATLYTVFFVSKGRHKKNPQKKSAKKMGKNSQVGFLPLKVVLCRRYSSLEARLSSKSIFNQCSSLSKGHLPYKVCAKFQICSIPPSGRFWRGLLPHSAPSWIFSRAGNLVSSSLQDGATKWQYFLKESST